jgi:hypothetical protein
MNAVRMKRAAKTTQTVMSLRTKRLAL